jgi:predicted small secreted protein
MRHAVLISMLAGSLLLGACNPNNGSGKVNQSGDANQPSVQQVIPEQGQESGSKLDNFGNVKEPKESPEREAQEHEGKGGETEGSGN